MKILVYPHDMAIGGSQINAVDLAAAVRDLGHEVLVFGQPGPLVDMVHALGLEFIASPPIHHRPTPSVVRSLRGLIEARGIDVLHGYEWPPALECLLAARRRSGSVAVATVMSMAVAPFLPKSVPLMVGTGQIADAERRAGRSLVRLLEPPVDIEKNAPGLEVGQERFRTRWGLDPQARTVAVVSRLAHEMKLEGILAAMDAVRLLDATVPVHLVVAGDGPAREAVRRRAEETNRATGRNTVVLTGELVDPRPAYAVADVALGMGGSALRAMAFGKPLVVQGEQGFWELLTPQSLDTFLWQGWYGAGPDAEGGSRRLAGILLPLLHDAASRDSLGDFARRTVAGRYSLAAAGRAQQDFYVEALRHRPGVRMRTTAGLASAGRFAAYGTGRFAARVAGRLVRDDFNAAPLAARPVPSGNAS